MCPFGLIFLFADSCQEEVTGVYFCEHLAKEQQRSQALCVQHTVLGEKTALCYRNTGAPQRGWTTQRASRSLGHVTLLTKFIENSKSLEVFMFTLALAYTSIQELPSLTESRHDSKPLPLVRCLQTNVLSEFFSVLHGRLDWKLLACQTKLKWVDILLLG